MGARGFAIAGGAVMAFGIGLFFVLATNRGWIDERARVALGATASGLVFAAGILLRARFGQYWAALAAVGAGIAGAYATLAAAAARYDLVPDALALPLAGVIAAAATVVAVRWRSQMIAALGLLGAALAPALQSLDSELTWESAAFAVIVLLATGAVAIPCRWRELLIAMSVVVGLEVEWLLASVDVVDTGTVVVASAFALAILGIAIGLQVTSGRKDVEPLALAYGLASFAVVLLASVQLFEDQTDRGIALLAAAGIWALAFAALQWRRLPDLAFALGASALALAAVGTADLLVGGTLTVVWAAEAVALAFVSWRLRDARVRAMAIGYSALAAVHALATDAGLDLLFDDGADHLGAVLPLASVAAAAAACGLLTPASYVVRTEDGLLAFLKELRLRLERHARGIAEALCFAGAAFATLACSFALVSVSFEKGHMAATTLAAAVGAVVLAVAALRRSPVLAGASYAWLGIVLAEPFAFDVTGGYDGGSKSFWGGLSIVAASAGLLAGGYAHRLIDPVRRGADAIHGAAAGIAAASTAFALPFFLDTERAGGVGLLGLALVYGVLAAAIFPRQGFRDASTTLWAIGLVALVAAEGLLVTDDVLRTVVIAGTGLAVGSLYRLLGESRFWLAGGVVVVLTTLASLVVAGPAVARGRGARAAAVVCVRRLRAGGVRARGARLARGVGAGSLDGALEHGSPGAARDGARAHGRPALDGVRDRPHRRRARGARAAARRGSALARRARGLRDRDRGGGVRGHPAVPSLRGIREPGRGPLDTRRLHRRARRDRFHGGGRPRPRRARCRCRRVGALRGLAPHSRDRRASLLQLCGNGLRARTHRGERALGAHRARPPRRRACSGARPRFATPASPSSGSASRRSSSTTSPS